MDVITSVMSPSRKPAAVHEALRVLEGE